MKFRVLIVVLSGMPIADGDPRDSWLRLLDRSRVSGQVCRALRRDGRTCYGKSSQVVRCRAVAKMPLICDWSNTRGSRRK